MKELFLFLNIKNTLFQRTNYAQRIKTLIMPKPNHKNSTTFEENASELGTFGKRELVKKAKNVSKQYCVGKGDGFKLEDCETKTGFNLGEEGKNTGK